MELWGRVDIEERRSLISENLIDLIDDVENRTLLRSKFSLG